MPNLSRKLNVHFLFFKDFGRYEELQFILYFLNGLVYNRLYAVRCLSSHFGSLLSMYSRKNLGHIRNC